MLADFTYYVEFIFNQILDLQTTSRRASVFSFKVKLVIDLLEFLRSHWFMSCSGIEIRSHAWETYLLD